MKTFKPFSIVAVPFPFTDGPKTKRRSAIVLSKTSYQKTNLHTCLLIVTSAKHSRWLGDHTIRDMDTTGLTSPSMIRQKLFTIDVRLIEKQVGVLSKYDQAQVLKHLCDNIQLTKH